MSTATATTKSPIALVRQGKPVTLWTGPSPIDGRIVRVIGRITNGNRKTGRVFGVSFYHVDNSGAGCSRCPLNDAGCYAELAHSGLNNRKLPLLDSPVLPRSQWQAAFGDEAIRLGVYGDPATVPARILREIIRYGRSHLGYTHLWRIVPSADYSPILMASAESLDSLQEIRSLGYRAFIAVRVGKARDAIKPDLKRPILKTIRAELSARQITDATVCPHFASSGSIQCSGCPVNCSGTSHGHLDVIIPAHGSRASSAAFQSLPILQ